MQQERRQTRSQEEEETSEGISKVNVLGNAIPTIPPFLG